MSVEWMMAAQLGGWVVRHLAGADATTDGVDVAGKIAGIVAMGFVGDAAKSRWAAHKATKGQRVGHDPLNHHIEQAYRMAELSSMVVFLKRSAEAKLLPGDPYLAEAEDLIRSLSERHEGVSKNAQAAYAEGLELDQLALLLSSMSERQWARADGHARALRVQIEDRALDELERAHGLRPAAEFEALLRGGHRDRGIAPWFGMLAHHFVALLLQPDKQKAQQSLMLRLVARSARTVEPQADLQGLERMLADSIEEQARAGVVLSDRIAAAIDQLGQELGSRLADVRGDVAGAAADLDAFRDAWEEGQRQLADILGRVEDLLEQQAALSREMHAMLVKLVERSDRAHALPAVAGGSLAAAAAWSKARLPQPPAAEGPPWGRDAALTALQTFLGQAGQRLLGLHGRRGSGKTSLAAWALAQPPWAAARPVIYLKASEVQTTLSAPLLGVIDQLLVALGADGVAADARLPSLAEKLGRISEVLRALPAPTLLLLDSLEHATDPDTGLLADPDLTQWLQHAAGPESGLQVIVITQQLPRLLVDGAARSLRHVAPGRWAEVSLGTGVDDEGACRKLMRALLGGARPDVLDDPTLPAVFSAVGGNPQALKHVALALADEPLLSPAALLESLRAPAGSDAGTQAVREVLMGRYFPRLPLAEQALLQAVAVLGGTAPLAAAEAVATTGAAREAGTRLAERHLLRLAATVPVLSIHDTEKAYYLATLDEAALRQAYVRAAAWWKDQVLPAERRWDGPADAQPALAALSMLVLAGDALPAAEWRQRTAARLADSGLVLSAMRVLEAATAAEQQLPSELERLQRLAACYWKVGASQAAHATCSAGLELGSQRGSPLTLPVLLTMRQLQATCEMELGRAWEAAEAGQELLNDLDAVAAEAGASEPASGESEQTTIACRTGIERGFALSVAGRQNDALLAVQQALGRLGRADDSLSGAEHRALRVLGLAYLGLVHSYRGSFAEARRSYDEAMALAARSGSLYERAIVLGHAAELDLIEGRLPLAMDRASRALKVEADTDAMNGSWCNWLMAMAWALTPALTPSSLADAEAHARLACGFTRLLNDPNPRVLLGILLLRRGEMVEGVAELEKAQATIDVLLDACPTNWEALVALGLVRLALSSCGLSTAEDAVAAYSAAHAASPYRGHHARIALQVKLAEPLLAGGGGGIDVQPALRALYLGA